jgi:anthranilate synthase component 2
MLVLIDNYDSFTYNLSQYFGELGQDVKVIRNDEISVEEISALGPSYLVLSPGPCTPNEAGICVPAIRHFAGSLPILGVCLGHQSIGAAFGADIVSAKQQMHGKISRIRCDEAGLFTGIRPEIDVVRYHSLVISGDSLNPAFDVTATTADGDIMGIRHRAFATTRYPVEGVQFHPESILTECGLLMLQNFLDAGKPVESKSN